MRNQGMAQTIMVMVLLAQGIQANHASAYDIDAYDFLYTQNNEDNTRSLLAVKIAPAGIERLKLDQQSYATYPWTDTLCLCHSRLFGMNYSGLYCLDLETGLTTRLVCDAMPHYDQLSCLDHRAYGVTRPHDSAQTIVILDFDRLAYSTLCPSPAPLANATIAPSPDHEFLAYHTQDPNGFHLVVINAATGDLVRQSKPFDFQIPMIASVFRPPPLTWIDEHQILSIESYTRGKFLSLMLKKRTTNQLIAFHLDTGRLNHILTLPGDPLLHFPPTLIQPTTSQTPRLLMNAPGFTDYRVDLKARKLVKDSIMGSPYVLSEGRLLFGNTPLGHAKRHQVNVDPTGTRIVWLQNETLYYHDSAQAGARRIARGGEIRGVTWIDPRASGRDLSGTPLPDGWTRFE